MYKFLMIKLLNKKMYKFFLKRLLDFLISLTALVVLFPIILIITIILAVSIKGNPFFTQRRPGKNEKIFTVVKFKTMSNEKDADGNLLPDEKRLTFIGRIIRQTSLDELPQLFNVLIGDMSLIGPRPLVPEYLPFYTDHHRKRHNVRPGITGLAQINGRQAIKFSQRFELDVKYVQSISLGLDLEILIKTFLKVFKKEDIIHGQTVDDVDDLGITKNLPSYHFRKKE